MQNTTLCYIENNNCYLMLHRVKKKNDLNHDKWVGVGGKFEEGESPEDCVCREALEETGLRLEQPEYRGLVTFVSDRWGTEYMHLFVARRFSGQMIECSEGNLEWVEKSRVRQLPLWEGDHLFFELLAQEHPFFSLKLVYHGERLEGAWLDGERIR